MADYKQTTHVITQWQRCFRAVIEHQRGEVPRIEFLEEVVTINGEETRQQVPGCAVVYEPTELVPLRSPVDDEPTGQTISQAEVYALLYSVYRYAADKRDAAQGVAA
jgi:hypothetical protein